MRTSLGAAALALFGSVGGCLAPTMDGDVGVIDQRLEGSNQSGSNLSGGNLGGTNLGGNNLGGVNLGGANLGGNNLGGNNLGGNNLGGTNLGGNNLGGTNLGGTNLGGNNLAGSNLGGSNLGGSNLGGTNLAGNNLAGTNLGGTTLSSPDTGRNIHGLSVAVSGMLYSGEDLWTPKTGQCVVLGVGSTAFPKLLGQQSAGARISVALGKLPWGFANSKGGPIALSAWEAVVWGDQTYCVFVLAADPGIDWPGVAGFIKAIFRWNAPVSQSMEVSGIEASAAQDSTVSTSITSYTGMMDAGSRWRAGTITDTAFLAGELAFATATTNNESVMVDFASWVQDKNKDALVLGNVEAASPPTNAEALYIALENGDGTVTVILDDAASRTNGMPAGMTNSVVDLNAAYQAWQSGIATKPVPRRCGGALFLNAWYGEPVPAGKCDSGLIWSPGFCIKGSGPWSDVAGTTAPMNGYMQLTQAAGIYQRGMVNDGNCGQMKTVISETYIHMWEPSYDLSPGPCTPETDGSFCARFGKNCGAFTGTDNCGNARTVGSCGGCGISQTCAGDGTPNVCGTATDRSYEAEAVGNTLAGTTASATCAQAYAKMSTPGAALIRTLGACSGGSRVGYIGNGAANTLTVNNVTVPSTGTYRVMVHGFSYPSRSLQLNANGGATKTVTMQAPDWFTSVGVTTTLSLNAGSNSIKLSSNSGWAPDVDRLIVSGGICTAESDASFCWRLAKNCGAVTGLDNCGNSRSVSSCGSCASPLSCGGGILPNVCGVSYEAESSVATRYGTAAVAACGLGAVCSGGSRVRYIGNGLANYIMFTITAPAAGNYSLALVGFSGQLSAFQVNINGGGVFKLGLAGPDANTAVTATWPISLKAGTNTIKLSNAEAYAPDLDRMILSRAY